MQSENKILFIYKATQPFTQLKDENILVLVKCVVQSSKIRIYPINEMIAYHKLRTLDNHCIMQKNFTKNNLTYRILQQLLQHQKEYFIKQEELVPYSRKAIALKLSISDATVSRKLSNLYFMYNKKHSSIHLLFPPTTHTGISSIAIQRAIRTMIAQEDKRYPFSDQHLVIKLSTMALNVSRRTITKYRIQMGISNSVKRKKEYQSNS